LPSADLFAQPDQVNVFRLPEDEKVLDKYAESPGLNLSDLDISKASAAPAPLAPANILLNIGIYQDVYVRLSVTTA